MSPWENEYMDRMLSAGEEAFSRVLLCVYRLPCIN